MHSSEYPRRPVGHGFATTLPTLDFETRSSAGYTWDKSTNKWKPLEGSPKRGIAAVGTAVYCEHPSTQVLLMGYNLIDGRGRQMWCPGMPDPEKLLEHVRLGGLLEFANSQFEYNMWNEVCVRDFGWPPLKLEQTRDVLAKARAHSVPGDVKNAGFALDLDTLKGGRGKLLIQRYSIPKQPSKKDPRRWRELTDDPVDHADFTTYCLQDVDAEIAIAEATPDLSPYELDVWLLDQEINVRGMAVDQVALGNCIAIVNQGLAQYDAEFYEVTDRQVENARKKTFLTWLTANGCPTDSVKKDVVVELLERVMPDNCRRALEIRQIVSSESVKKVFAILRMLARDGRLHGLLVYAGADRTARFAGRGPQPQNLPNNGPPVALCLSCGWYHRADSPVCTLCGSADTEPAEWCFSAVECALQAIASRSLSIVEQHFGDALTTVSGCLRSLFVAAPGHELICSDFSAIEAVVAAELAGETWRQDVFRTHGKIYEMSAAKITGVPFEEFLEHKRRTGKHHPLRKSIGKIAELASIYKGWIGAWKAFGADKYFSDDREIRDKILGWREASPAIVEAWGGQVRETSPGSWQFRHELFGLEGAAIQAILNPGQGFAYKGLTYCVIDDVLYCKLPSGRHLTYHKPRLFPVVDRYSKETIWQITYMGWNTDEKKGPRGWVRLSTHGGKLFENCTQAVARDILVHAMLALDAAGYNIVLHVHDEIIVEVLAGTGSIEEVERIMSTMPDWCKDWPVKAAGGWRGVRYRKE